MSLAAACGGWLTAGLVAASWLLMHRAVNSRMEAVARRATSSADRSPRLGSGSSWAPAAVSSPARSCGRSTPSWAAPRSRSKTWRGRRNGRMAPRAFELVDLGELLSDSVQAWRPAAARAGVELRLLCRRPMPPVRGDRLRLAQAAGNLIANAIEHGGGHVDVRGCTSGTGARIEVIDDGPGLPAPLAEIVGRARRGRGTRGRGLAIAAAIAALHGGRLMRPRRTAVPTWCSTCRAGCWSRGRRHTSGG